MLKNYFLLEKLCLELTRTCASRRVADVFTQLKNEVIFELDEGFLVLNFHRDAPFFLFAENIVRKRQSMSILPSLHGEVISDFRIINNKRIIAVSFNEKKLLVNLVHGKNGATVFGHGSAVESVKTEVAFTDAEDVQTEKHFTALLKAELEASGKSADALLDELYGSDNIYWYEKDGAHHITPIEMQSLGDWRLVSEESGFLAAFAKTCFRYTGQLRNVELKEQLSRCLAKQTRYFEKTLQTISDTLTDESGQERFEQFGHLILSHLHQIKPYDTALRVENWFANPPAEVTISLKENLTPQENAERYYRKAKAFTNNKKKLAVRRDHAEKKLATCQSLTEKLSGAFRGKQLEQVRQQLIAESWLAPETAKDRKTMNYKPSVNAHEFTIDGREVLVGKDSKSNDFLSLRASKANDIWFHVQGSPGSHVILRWHGEKDNPPKDLIEKVASLTAFYSKQKNAGTIPVIYTQAKYVRKPRGAKAGAVTVQYEKSVFVKPKAYEDLV